MITRAEQLFPVYMALRAHYAGVKKQPDRIREAAHLYAQAFRRATNERGHAPTPDEMTTLFKHYLPFDLEVRLWENCTFAARLMQRYGKPK